MKVSSEVQAIFNAAYNEAKLRNHEYLMPEHILFASLSFEKVRAIFESCDADLEQMRRSIGRTLSKKCPLSAMQNLILQDRNLLPSRY